MKNTVTSKKATGSTAEKKKAAAPEIKAVADEAPQAVTKTKAATKTAVKPSSVTILPETQEPKVTHLSHEQIAARAYLLWEATGYQHGNHEEHWLKAEMLLKSELGS